MKLIKYLNNITLLVCITFIAGCCSLNTRELTPFPIQGNIIEYTKDPVISYNNSNQTYIVTKEMVNNAVQYKIYVNEVNKWKTLNGIE